MQLIKISELISHPKNNYYFDDIEGEAWQEFLKSIETSGVIEPIVITPEKIIVSGHQRVRACKALGVTEIMAEVKMIDSDDEILKQLIETNIRQRGIGNTNPVKFGRCIKELERIYGIKNGGDRKSDGKYSQLKTQSDLADELGIDVKTLSNYKALANAIPEVQSLIETGIVTPTTARAIMKQLSEEQQKELAKQFSDKGEKVTNKEAEKEIQRLKSENNELTKDNTQKLQRLSELTGKISILDAEVKKLQKELDERPEKEIQVKPNDYDAIKNELKSAQSDYSFLKKEYDKKVGELSKLKEELKAENVSQEQFRKKLKDSCLFFCGEVASFIERVGGYVWIVDHLNELPDYERKSYKSAINAVGGWWQNLSQNIE